MDAMGDEIKILTWKKGLEECNDVWQVVGMVL